MKYKEIGRHELKHLDLPRWLIKTANDRCVATFRYRVDAENFIKDYKDDFSDQFEFFLIT